MISGSANRQVLQFEEETGGKKPAPSPQRRGRLQLLLALLGAVGVFLGVRLAHSQKRQPTLTPQALAGTWELKAIKEDQIGPGHATVIMRQTMTFTGSHVDGETHLHANTEAATLAMPFPDAGVDSVQSSADGQEVTVLWSGTLKIVRDDLLELHIGKATARLKIKFHPVRHEMELEHDAILTYPGQALYRAKSAN